MASGDAVLEVYCPESVVHGHHVYKQKWIPVVGEKLPLGLKKNSGNDPKAVAVLKHGCGLASYHRRQSPASSGVEAC